MKLKDVFVKADQATGKYVLTTREANDGFALTSDLLSSLSQENLPNAIELLSKLTVNGKLGVETLNKMFELVDIYSRNAISKVA